MITVTSLEQNDALVGVLEDERTASKIEIEGIGRAICVDAYNSTHKITRRVYVFEDGSMRDSTEEGST